MKHKAMNDFETVQEAETITQEEMATEIGSSSVEEIWEEIDIEGVEDVEATQASRSVGEAGVLSIINTSENGRRLHIAKHVMDKIGSPEKLEIKTTATGILLIRASMDSKKTFNVKEQKSKYIVYCGPLVKELTDKFSLNYDETTSLTFTEATFGVFSGRKVAQIRLV